MAGMFEVERGGWKEYFVKILLLRLVCVVMISIVLDRIKYKYMSLPIISLVITRQIITRSRKYRDIIIHLAASCGRLVRENSILFLVCRSWGDTCSRLRIDLPNVLHCSYSATMLPVPAPAAMLPEG